MSESDSTMPVAQKSVSDLVTLLISLASGVLALSATFTEKLSVGAGSSVIILYLSWAVLVTSIFFGVRTLSKLAHAQITGATEWANMTLPSMRQCWRFFQAGIVLLMIYAAAVAGLQARSPKTTPEKAGNCECCTPGERGEAGPPGPQGPADPRGGRAPSGPQACPKRN